MFASAVFIGSCKSDLVWSALSQSAAAKVLRKKQLLQLLIPVTIVVRVFSIIFDLRLKLLPGGLVTVICPTRTSQSFSYAAAS